MTYEFIQRTVGQVVREKNDPVAIRRAFALKCSGVIVATEVPETVTAEIARISDEQFADYMQPLKKTLKLDCRSDDKKHWFWENHHPSLCETFNWLNGEMEELVAAGWQPPFIDSPRNRNNGMTVWLADDFATQWHVDNQHIPEYPDIHLHVHGAGMYVASATVPKQFFFKSSIGDSSDLIIGAKIDPDHQTLQDNGFEIIQLQPGEKLIHTDSCLHASYRGLQQRPGKIKLRASVF